MNTPHNMNSSTSHHSEHKARFRKSTFCWGFLLCMGGIFFCIYLNASKNIEINVIEKNKVRILIGFIEFVFENNASPTSLKLTLSVESIKIAPNKATNQ